MDKEEITLALTSENSHQLSLPLGQGSLAIGTVGMDKKLFDVLVDGDTPINWNAFNNEFTGHGKQNQQDYPFGNWPRFFYYYGNDTGFIKWSEKRKIEDFSWTPQKPVSEDFTHANIRTLHVTSDDIDIDLKLGIHLNLTLIGCIEKINVQSLKEVSSLQIHPSATDEDTYQLPQMPALKDQTSVDITMKPLGQAFDCKSLLQFKQLKSLSLSGHLTNLECLKELTKLESLAIRYSPNLEALPDLNSWQKLTSFIGFNIEETQGKRLRTQLRQLAKEKELKYSSVSQLRKKIWFTTEYGIPFSGWSGKEEKAAVKAYKATLKKLKKAKTEDETKTVLIEFIETFNTYPNIETIEREDIGIAVEQLREASAVILDSEITGELFDRHRDY